SGSIVVDGTELTKLSRTKLAKWRAANLGYVFQTHNLVPVLTAYENIELPLLLLPMSRAERRQRVQIALEAVDLIDRAGHYPRQMSGGQEQRVGIARAIVNHPQVVVADEPTGDLDPETSQQILHLLGRLNRELGVTLLMVTHDHAAAKVAHRQFQLDRGKLIETTDAEEGMADLQSRQAAKGSLIVFQANKFCPASSHLPQDYQQQIEKMPGVAEVIPIQVFTNNCRASLDVIVFYGLPPAKVRKARDFQLMSGSWDEFETHQDAAIVGSSVASRRGIGVGDKFSIGDLTVQVAGVFTSSDPAEENYIYSHLEFLQRGKGMNLVGTVTQHEVLLQPGTDQLALCEMIDEKFRGGSVETDTRPKGVFQAKSLGDLTQLVEMSKYLGYACVAIVLALVSTTTVMSVQDRIKEHAVLQTLGFTGRTVFALVLSESVVLSVLGGALGIEAAYRFPPKR
ncbi:ytrE, partial [Symbiodinium sp. CCMP2456]